MSYRLVVQSEAIIDIQEAFVWYETQRAGLGYELIEELEEAYQKLSDHPFHYTAINHHFRRLKVNRFPYLIVYEIEGDAVIITAVRHGRRKPNF